MDVSSPAGQRPQIGAILVAQDGIVAIIAGERAGGRSFRHFWLTRLQT